MAHGLIFLEPRLLLRANIPLQGSMEWNDLTVENQGPNSRLARRNISEVRYCNLHGHLAALQEKKRPKPLPHTASHRVGRPRRPSTRRMFSEAWMQESGSPSSDHTNQSFLPACRINPHNTWAFVKLQAARVSFKNDQTEIT